MLATKVVCPVALSSTQFQRSDGSSWARKAVVGSLALSAEASRDKTGLEFPSAFSVNSKVLACAEMGASNGQIVRNLNAETCVGGRLQR